MRALKISTSGVRGTVGWPFTPELAIEFAQAFATYVGGGTILVARDSRRSGEMFRAAVVSGLLAAGIRVVDLGICPTPSLQLAVIHRRARGGIAITAGHNPEGWNALKFIRDDGIYLNARQGEELLDVFHQREFHKARWDRIRPLEVFARADDLHRRLLRARFDIERIRRQHFLVAVDCANGACATLTPQLLEEVGCRVVPFNDRTDDGFPHDPNPNPSAMNPLAALCKAIGATIGFAHDADGERLGIVDDRGQPLDDELTLAIAVEARLSARPGLVVTNVSTSRILDVIAERHGGRVLRTPVGQAYVSEAVRDRKAVLGGEGSGGVIVPEVLLSHDAAAAMLLILEYLAGTGSKVSEVVAGLPRRFMRKGAFPMPPRTIYSFLSGFRDDLERNAGAAGADFTDGVLIREREGWVHFRASNTEPLLRVIAEATTEEDLDILWRRAERILQEGGVLP